MLIKIGDFARESGVTVKALRHYEHLNLLRPAWINRYNGYRYYAPEQKVRLELILAYKRMGFPLAQIGKLLEEQLTDTDLVSLLQNRKSALVSQIEREQIKLDAVESSLNDALRGGRRKLESSLSHRMNPKIEEKMKESMEIEIKNIPALKLVGLRYQGRNEQNEIVELWTAFNRLSGQIKHFTGEAAYGVCSIPDSLPEGEFEYLCAFPVAEYDAIPEGMVSMDLEPMRVAVFAHCGSQEGLGDTYTRIYQEWLPQAELEPLKAGLDLEVYTEEFKDFASDSVMYIYVPVKA
ncbi:MerR family transcriptional regulator [Pelolinea submarina]|uniref:Putative transcriptional regulator YdeE n=1 Tax=Pelolinea submarina TaxID=913107 RepID=A0A347ZNP8_9CHLR|nr:MerR family transcriptional regulator [Pelolinea submarina]REG08532.1 putative transcriptional regulator YdeE [Pelolinea submarina]BBB46929.1 AraC family transcriptional regulator [Pelolinea submarina]